MQTKVFLAIAATAALVAACDRGAPKPSATPSPSSGASQIQGGSAPSNSGVQSSAAAATSGTATGEGANPHQQHADPKEAPQRRDFEQRGDQAGPKSPETSAKPGS
jgi:hypothetical protein